MAKVSKRGFVDFCLYEESELYTKEEVEEAIAADNVAELIPMVISVSVYSDGGAWAEHVCLRLANHSNFNVRGNAVLGFGHIARVRGKIDNAVVKSLITAALIDENEYVRGQAHAAADDLSQYLGWQLKGTA